MPSVAVRELEADPEGLFDMLKLRAYASAKTVYERAETEEQIKKVTQEPLVKLVEENHYEIAGALLKARRDAKR